MKRLVFCTCFHCLVVGLLLALSFEYSWAAPWTRVDGAASVAASPTPAPFHCNGVACVEGAHSTGFGQCDNADDCGSSCNQGDYYTSTTCGPCSDEDCKSKSADGTVKCTTTIHSGGGSNQVKGKCVSAGFCSVANSSSYNGQCGQKCECNPGSVGMPESPYDN